MTQSADDYTIFSNTPLWETYNFMVPGAEYVRPGQFNAKNMPYNAPGVGATNAGVSTDNIFSTLDNLYNQYGQYESAGFKGGDKMGGNKSIWKALRSVGAGDMMYANPKYYGQGTGPLESYEKGYYKPSTDETNYVENLQKANPGTGITSLILNNFIRDAKPTSQADALSKLKAYNVFGNEGQRNLLEGQLSKYGSTQYEGLNKYLNTGEIDTSIFSPLQALQAYDYGQRESAKTQQTKPGSVLEQVGGAFADYVAPALIAFGGPVGAGIGIAAQAGAGAARGQGFGDIVLNAGQSAIAAGAPIPGIGSAKGLTNLQAAALNAGVTGARGGSLRDAALTGAGTYFGRGGIDAVNASKAQNLVNNVGNFTSKGLANILGSGTGSALKQIGTNIAIDTFLPEKPLQEYAGQTQNPEPNNTGIATLENQNQTTGQNIGASPYIDPVAFRGIGALGPAFMNVYERAARGLS